MLTNFPLIKPYQEHHLPVSKIHTIYLEECGNPDGLPVLYLHGGPGAGCNNLQRTLFDPEIYRIILFDQRGAGRSTPHAELLENTTQELIMDIEKIRTYLNINRWVIAGGSWGAALALLYAQQHPELVLGLILRSINLARPQDIDWLCQTGTRRFFPDYWQDLTTILTEEEQSNIIEAYYQRLTGNDDLIRMAAAKCWSTWVARCSTLEPNPHLVEQCSEPYFANAVARLQCHYIKNHYFIENNQILNNMHAIQHVPGIIIHGRYDTLCPIDGAFELNRSWLQSELKIIRNAGHVTYDSGMLDALLHATREMAKILRF